MKQVIVLTLTALIMLVSAAMADTELSVKPYGFVLSNAQYNSNVKADIPTSAVVTDSTKNLLLTARQTRFGLTMGMEELGWKLGGKVELDFWGLKGFGKNGGSMQSAPRLRLAYFQMTKGKVTLVFGQDWIILAPLSPETDAHVSIPEFSGSGNLWNRMPQIRFEYKNVVNNKTTLAQLALVRPLASDMDPSTEYKQTDQLGAGELNGLPFVQGRLAYSPSANATFGVSGQLGQEDFEASLNDTNFTEKTSTYAGAVDIKVGSPTVTLMAEGFIGANLITAFSGASYFKDMISADSLYKNEPLKVKGGWVTLGIKPANSKVMFNGGFGIEILDDEQTDSIAVGGVDAWKLSKNFTVFGNILYSPLTKIRLGCEIGYIKTTYKMWQTASDPASMVEDDGDNVCLNLSAKFSF